MAPYQTVCNYLNYFFTPLGTHLSEAVPGGTSQRILAKLLFGGQPNNLGTTESSRPVDTPGDPHEESVQALHKQPNSPAVDSRGRADCQAGQTGYLSRLVTDGRYPRETDEEGVPRRRHARGLRSRHAGPEGRHLQGARARHRQRGGRALMRRPRLSGLQVGLLAIGLIVVFVFFAFTKSNPFANPYELQATLPRRPQHRHGLAGADRGRGGREGHEARVERRRRGHGDDGARATTRCRSTATPR